MKPHEALHLSPFLQLTLLLFSIGVCLLGLFLDGLSLVEWSKSKGSIQRRKGLPIVPWMLYFTSGFFLFLRENLIAAVVLITLLTAWHLVVRSKVRN